MSASIEMGSVNTRATRKPYTPLRTLKFLALREYWDFKNLFVVLPLVLSFVLLMFFSFVFVSMINQPITSNAQQRSGYLVSVFVTGNIFPTIFMWLSWTLAFVSFYYLMSALQADRADRSVLFWKSLPIADWELVLSKLVLPLIVAPLIAFVLSLLSYLILAVVIGIYASLHGLSVMGSMLFQAQTWREPFQVMATLPIYVLWALPTVGWILMVSSWTKSRVFPWVLGAPLLAWLIVVFGNFYYKLNIDILWWSVNTFSRLVGGLFPGMWTLIDSIEPQTLVDSIEPQIFASEKRNLFILQSVYQQAWLELVGLRLWLGALSGAVFISVAIRLRRYADVI